MAGNVTERSIKLNVTAEADPSMMSNLDRFAKQAEERISLRKPDPIIEAFTPNWREKAMTQELLRLAEEEEAASQKRLAREEGDAKYLRILRHSDADFQREAEAKRLQEADAERKAAELQFRVFKATTLRQNAEEEEKERQKQDAERRAAELQFRVFKAMTLRQNAEEEAALRDKEAADRKAAELQFRVFKATTLRQNAEEEEKERQKQDAERKAAELQFRVFKSMTLRQNAEEEEKERQKQDAERKAAELQFRVFKAMTLRQNAEEEAALREKEAAERKAAEIQFRAFKATTLRQNAEEQEQAENQFLDFKLKTLQENATRQTRLQEALHDDRRRAMSTEDRINDDHEQRVATIRRELSLTQQQTDELIRQSGLIRDQALVRNQRTIEFERRNAALHAAGQNARLGPMMQEAGRGLEDFIVGFSMAKNSAEGLALGLRGAANNMGQLASFAGPMVGAYVAIGAALSTIIVPKVVEWLFNTEELTKRLEEYKNKLKEIGVDAKSAASDAVLFSGMNSADDFNKEMEKRENAVNAVAAAYNAQAEEARGLKDEIKELDRLNDEELAKRRKFADEASDPETAIAIMAGAKLLDTSELKSKLKAAEEAMQETRKEGEKREIELERARAYREQVSIREQKKLEEKALQDAARNEISEWEQSNQFDAFVAEQRKERAIKAIDDQIEAQQSKLEGLQDRQSNPNGPSSHAFFGSQTTASIINRAISGSATVEDTLKAQLKVEKEQLKELQRQKKAMTIRI